ncbi:sensor histidine kinase, partial [Acidobacteriota bacterium]
LLRLQSTQIQNKKALESIKKGQDRIMSMALVHEKLYKSKDFSKINFAQYMKDLSEHLFQTYRIAPETIELHSDVKDISINVNQAIPLGLIVNELITNALKHAFPGGKKGRIRISLKLNKNKERVLTVSDDGIGLPQNFDLESTTTLGMVIVNDLVKQIDARLIIRKSRGTAFTVIF